MKYKHFDNDDEKGFYLRHHCIRLNIPNMEDEMICLQCNSLFKVKDFKVVITTCDCCNEYMEYIVCPNAPDCEGDMLDWVGKEILN